MSVKERLKQAISHHKLSVVDFEKKIGVANGYVNSISKSVGIDKLNKIIELFPNINLYWLITGEGPMILTDEQRKILIESEVYKDLGSVGEEAPEFKTENFKQKYFAALEQIAQLQADKIQLLEELRKKEK